jgi:pimeloyl-ACP methyl ester carboxylesterase
MNLGSAVALAVTRIVQPVEGMHYAIARPWFTALGPAGKPLQATHEGIARIVYDSIRLAASAIELGLDSRDSSNSGSGAKTRAVITGLWGDSLGSHTGTTAMSIRDHTGSVIPLRKPELEAAYPQATDRLVVLTHGLVETERRWMGDDAESGVLTAISANPALTPIAIRYNSGLAVSTNGDRLANLLDELQHKWPVPVRSIALVGHSMGGLVIRNACVAAQRAGYPWVDQVDRIVTIGSPIRGTPIEKAVAGLARGLSVAPQTRPLSDFINTRSQGIKDLGWGEPSFEDVGADSSGLDGAIRHHFVAGVVTSDPAHPVGVAIGDLIVRPTSGIGAPEVDSSNVALVGGVNHFDLANDPRVVQHLVSWLT